MRRYGQLDRGERHQQGRGTLAEQVRRQLPDCDPTALTLLLWVTRLGRLLELFHQHAALAELGVDVTSRAVLVTLLLAEPEPLSPTDLARTVVQTSGGMTKTLQRLEGEGLVARRPNEADGRAAHIALTPKGRRLSRELLVRANREWQRVLDQLSDDRARTIATIRALVAALEATADQTRSHRTEPDTTSARQRGTTVPTTRKAAAAAAEKATVTE